MPWCNLFSIESKYNIGIKPSRYRNLLVLATGVFSSLLLISYSTYAYQVILVITVITITIMSVLITKRSRDPVTRLHFTLDQQGICAFESASSNPAESPVEINVFFQLLASSRYSFFGCWLDMVPLSNLSSSLGLSTAINKKSKKTRLFIYRDSLTAVDFSRLAQVIRKL